MPEKPPSSRERPKIAIPALVALNRPENLGGPAYAELLAASNFSFLRGASHPEELAATATALGLAGFSIVDRNTLAGIVRGHLAAKTAGARYAVGCRLAFRDGTPDIAVWPTDRAAYGRLCRLLSTGNLRTKKGECHLDLADLVEWGKGMEMAVLPGRSLASSPSRRSLLMEATKPPHAEVPAKSGPRSTQNGFPSASLTILRGGPDCVGPTPQDEGSGLDRSLSSLSKAFPGHVRLGATCLYQGNDKRRLARISSLAAQHKVPMLALGDVLYHAPERRRLQDVLSCVREKRTLETAGKLLEINAERHMKSAAEMTRLFADYPEAIAETLAVLARLDFSLDQLAYDYPLESAGESATPFDELVRLTWLGAAERYSGDVPENVKNILEHELKIIEDLKYEAYFLTVRDIMEFARSVEILCQGRGSAANSAVCYCLRITDVNPALGNCLFERFISRDRNEPPDIDVDFEHERREEVMQYVFRKYGYDHAGIAATVITYRSRSAAREVGKAFGLSEDAVGALAGNVWGWSSTSVDGADARRAGLDPSERRIGQVLEMSQEIIGFPRHLSQHVGGFLITRSRLDEVVPILHSAMDGRNIIEWDKDDLDALKMLKIDVLALGMLTALKRGFDLLQAHYGVTLDLAKIQQEEVEVYDMICRADTVGVFQIESRAQMTMLPRLRPRTFYDLVIEVAIVRPGPIQGDMVHPYLRRRQGIEKVNYPRPHPDHGPPDELERVLGKTLGVPLFQEQAMKIAIVAAKFEPGEADRLRRAMATFRRVGTIGLFKAKMIEGMVSRGYERSFAERCFSQIEGFGEYGFPESHAASFALLVYASAWIKCHYPDVFCASLLNAQPMGFYAPAQLVRDAREHGVEMREVDINFSDWDSTLEDEWQLPLPLPEETCASPPPCGEGLGEGYRGAKDIALRSNLGLGATPSLPTPARGEGVPTLKGRGSTPALHHRHISQAPAIRTTHAVRLGLRQIKGFREADAANLVAARGTPFTGIRDLWLRSGLSRAALERLAEADAFRSIGLDRRAALWEVRALDPLSAAERLPIFASAGDVANLQSEPQVELPLMPQGEHVVSDYRSLSLSLKAHPVSFFRREFFAAGIVEAGRLSEVPNGRRVSVAGLVLVRQRPGTASGVIFATLEDETGVANVIVWPKIFERFRPIVLGARLLRVFGKLQSEQSVIHIVAERLEDMTPLLSRLSDMSIGANGMAPTDEVKRPVDELRHVAKKTSRMARMLQAEPDLVAELKAMQETAAAMPKGRNFH
jgi:error-prone DNA polymerase